MKHQLKMTAAALVLALLGLPSGAPATLLNDPANPVQFRTGTELGFLGVVAHTIQFGQNGTKFDYVKHGGQDNLLLFERLTAELQIKDRHEIIFLYQPLDVRTQAPLEETLQIYDQVFPAGTPMDFRYGFDFYRLSYMYDFLRDPEKELAVGASMQIRNATIAFTSQDGKLSRRNANIGPVPILKFRGRFPLNSQSWLGTEVDGFYASSSFFNGASFDFTGSILDASVRYGLRLNESLDGFLNLRFLGGGAKGQSQYRSGLGDDGYTDNSLNTVSLSLGFYMK
jgi:hypothetical protein